MKRSTSRWIVGFAVGGIVHIGLFWVLIFLGRPESESLVRHHEGARLVYMGADDAELSPIMRQQIELFDPKPLMQPTVWNTANFDRVEAYIEADLEIFVDYKPIYGSEEGEFISTFGNPWRPAGTARENVLDYDFDVTRQFGRVALNRTERLSEGIELEVIRMKNGEPVFEEIYYNSVAQEILEFPGSWGIASFIVQIVDSFQVGLPSMDESVGDPEVDRRINDMVVRELLPKGLLGNGSYRVRISR